jgi:23S rRNA pseudouridine2605 synthase
MAEERLQKILARAGFGSRRTCEEYITAGRVIVNGKKAELGQKADAGKDSILLDGIKLPAPKALRYLAYNKPRFVLCDKVEGDTRRTVYDLVPDSSDLAIVGRLDFESEGLIILTNDGELTNALTHPRYQHEKEYRVLVASRPDPKQLEIWRRGIILEDGHKTQPASVSIDSTSGKGAWLRVVMKEGHKRQIREIAKTIGLYVVRLVRVRIGSLELGTLKSGLFRELSAEEIVRLKNLVKNKKKAAV